jgi:hypothetical protein
MAPRSARFRPTFDVVARGDTLAHLLEALTLVNCVLLGEEALPPLYESGVSYRRESRGTEHWKTAPRTFLEGHGDCEDLAAWRAAELRRAGETTAKAVPIRINGRLWHAVVWRANGDVEDPSKKLGMKGRA